MHTHLQRVRIFKRSFGGSWKLEEEGRCLFLYWARIMVKRRRGGRVGEAEVWGWREKVVCQLHLQPLCCKNHPWLAQFWCDSTLLLAKILKLVNMCSRIR